MNVKLGLPKQEVRPTFHTLRVLYVLCKKVVMPWPVDEGAPAGGYNTYCIKDELTISMAFPGPVRAGVMIPCRVLYSTYVGGVVGP